MIIIERRLASDRCKPSFYYCSMSYRRYFGLQHFKLIPLLLQKVNGARQCILQVSVAPGFQGIVEGDDGAVAGVAHHVGKHLRTAQLLAVVAGHEVPHHNLVGSFQREILVGEHMAVGRAEQERVENLLHIAIDVPTHFHENLRLLGISQIILAVYSNPRIWLKVWLPMRCPRSTTIRNSSGCFRMLSPTMKKVALMLCLSSRSSTQGVTSGIGPSSKVR